MQKPQPIQFILNGQPREICVDSDLSLLDLLRDHFNLTAAKNGCSPQGSCGACTVLVDDKAVVSCALPVAKIAGKHVQTLEGLSDHHRQILARSFVFAGGLQCGFCIPGIAMRAHSLLQNNPTPTRDEIARALNNHICRCTGYKKIIDAIALAAKAYRGESLPEQEDSGRVGSSLLRYQGENLTLGSKRYIDDMKMPEMLHGAVLFSAHPRAKVLAIDTSKAEKMEGVKAVITAKDVPGNRYEGLIEKDWPVFIAVGEETRYVGDILAAVAATSKAIARAALDLIEVQYEVLKPMSSTEEALKPGAPLVHPEAPRAKEDGNLLSKSVIKRGDVDKALAEAAFVATETFQTQLIEHAFLEPESCLAYPENGYLRVLSQGQGVFDDQRQIASILGVPVEQVHVELVSNGGAFGGKEDLSIQGHAALLAKVTGKPVKLTLSREESIRMHPKRHPIRMTYTVGCDKDGHLLAVKARMVGDKGAYASVGAKVLERAAGHATGPYRVPNVDVEALAVYTNNPPCGAMRGFGVPQAAFAIEGMLDILAEKVGIDGWEMRWRNVLEVGDAWCSGQILEKSVGIKKTLLAVKDLYKKAKYAGIACGIKNVGIGNGVPEYGRACLRVESPERINIYTGYTEMGQGLFTVLIQFACEVTGLPAKYFEVKVDTQRPLDCGMTTASRATVLGGNAVKKAAEKLKADLQNGMTLGDLVGKEYFGEIVIDYTTALGANVAKPITHITFGFATQVAILDDNGKLVKFVAAHDVGRVINPTLLEGQIEGSIHMGLGYALTEELKVINSVPESYQFRRLGLIRAKDMPEIETIFIEEYEPEGPFGAKGVGEIGLVPTAPAVASALYKFDGIRRTSLPMKDSPAARLARGRSSHDLSEEG
ncbi:MAG: selenium-dependent xanthine dehydrogenase [candidate division KSB1 bacterium]|nr:selenium-dependent xanthine dehydrogenase [candidate division KSB1 bacterium]